MSTTPHCDYCDDQRRVENIINLTSQQGMKDCPACVQKVAGKTPLEWEVFARQDNCLENMVPSELRALVAKVKL